jgi:hypothetical protein
VCAYDDVRQRQVLINHPNRARTAPCDETKNASRFSVSSCGCPEPVLVKIDLSRVRLFENSLPKKDACFSHRAASRGCPPGCQSAKSDARKSRSSLNSERDCPCEKAPLFFDSLNTPYVCPEPVLAKIIIFRS